MKNEHRQILMECHRRMQALAAGPRPPAWQRWDCERHDEQLENGPHYGCGQWFGDVPEHERQRLRRAIDDLERGGLLTTWSAYGRRLTSIKLTAEGERIVAELAAAAARRRS